MIKVGNDSFLQTKFGPKASETISQRRFLPKKSYAKERFTRKIGNDSFLQSKFGAKASETISQRRFLLKI
jgi:NADH:ubiquinone oxidoreductase subunit